MDSDKKINMKEIVRIKFDGGEPVERYHLDTLGKSDNVIDLLAKSTSGINFNIVDGTVAAAVNENSPWVLYKGHSQDTWFYAPRWGRLGQRPDGTPNLTLTYKVKNNPDGSRTPAGGTMAFLFELAQELPTDDEIEEWNDRIRRLHNIAPTSGTSFRFQPLQLTAGKMSVFGLEGKAIPGQGLTNVNIGASSNIAFAVNLEPEAAEDYYKQIRAQANIPPQVAIICSFSYRYILPTCRIRISGSKKKTYNYFSENVQARGSYWGLWGGSYDRSRTRVDLKNEGGLQIEVVGEPPEGFELQTLMDALFDRFLTKEAGNWINPDATPIRAPAPGGFFGGVSYAMKEIEFSDEDVFEGEINFAGIATETHQLSFNFESAFSTLDPEAHTALLENDRVLDLKIAISNTPLVSHIAPVVSYTREGSPIRVAVPNVGPEGGVTTGAINWSPGIEQRPTSAQSETGIMFISPHRDYVHSEMIDISDAGGVLLINPDAYVVRTELLFIFDYEDPGSMAFLQWKWTPPDGSNALSVQRTVRIGVDAEQYNTPSSNIVFPVRPADYNGSKLVAVVEGIRGDWRGMNTGVFEIPVFAEGALVDWDGIREL
jgi:hypothetical protein